MHDLPKRETNSKDRISKDEKEKIITEKRSELLSNFVAEALLNYSKANNGPLPEQIVIYRDGIGGPTLQ
jgi:predicted Zn-dependent protease with MMP-like domain